MNLRRGRSSAGPRTFEHVIDRGCRRGLDAEQEAALDEDDPPDSLGVAGGAMNGDEPAHRVPDDGCVRAPMRSRTATRSSACASMTKGPVIDALAPRPRRSGAANVPLPSSAPVNGAQQRWLAVTPWAAAATGSPGDPPMAPTTRTQAASQGPGCG